MIFTRCLLMLLGTVLVKTTAKAELLAVSDERVCIDLCTSCNGKPIFENNVCECQIANDNLPGAECISRIRRQAEQLGMDVISCDIDADRAARCISSPFLSRSKTKNDVDLVAKYFMGDSSKGGLGSLLGSWNSPSETENSKSRSASEASASSSAPVESADKSHTPSEKVDAVVGSENPNTQASLKEVSDAASGASDLFSVDRISQLPSDLVDAKPFLGAAAAWLQPSNLVAIGNGLQGIAPSAALLAQQHNQRSSSPGSSNGLNGLPTNTLGSPFGAYNSQNGYSAGPNFGLQSLLPYAFGSFDQGYNQLRDASPGYQSQSYVDNYNTMVGGLNQFFGGANRGGMSPYFDYPTLGEHGGLDGGISAAATSLLGDSDSLANRDVRKSKDTEIEKNEMETVGNGKDSAEVSSDEVKERNMKIKKNKFKSKESYTKAEKTNGKRKE